MITASCQMGERTAPVMGTDAHLVVVGGDPRILDIGVERLHELEQRWSRFLDNSEITALNRHAGHPVLVSTDTYDLIARSVQAWHRTGGRFDPTVGAALVALGYDRDFAAVAGPVATAAPTAPAPGLSGIVIDPCIGAVTLPEGVNVDPGGIGKGLAADLTARLLVDAGADGTLVNVGGDLRALGQPPSADGWVITIPDPQQPARELLRLAVPDGAVATSSRLQRRWQTTIGDAHHLIDPQTGRPADTDVVAVTVIAAEAWWAEALTKSLFLTGPDGLTDLDAAHAVIVTSDGARHASASLATLVQ